MSPAPWGSFLVTMLTTPRGCRLDLFLSEEVLAQLGLLFEFIMLLQDGPWPWKCTSKWHVRGHCMEFQKAVVVQFGSIKVTLTPPGTQLFMSLVHFFVLQQWTFLYKFNYCIYIISVLENYRFLKTFFYLLIFHHLNSFLLGSIKVMWLKPISGKYVVVFSSTAINCFFTLTLLLTN